MYISEEIEITQHTEVEHLTSIVMKEEINKLGENFKEIIVLYYYNDFSVSEISNILNIAEGTVKSRLSRARDELKKNNLEGWEE